MTDTVIGRMVALANSLGGDDEQTIMDGVAELAAAAAFLDRLAESLWEGSLRRRPDCAAECRAMAAKLRGETREPPPPPDERGTSMV